MIYIYDILLNFCDCDMLYDFYEWNQSDAIENIKRIKLLHVDRKVFDNLLYYDIKMDSDFLLKIYRTCEVYTTKKVKIIDYCCLFSDGDRVIAIEFDKGGNVLYKSKLLLDEEEEIAVLADNLEIFSFKYELLKRVLDDRFFTRNELLIRKYLVKEIEECYSSKNYNKLKFLYQEYFEDDDLSYIEMKKKLLDSLKLAVDDKHIGIYQLLKSTSKKKQV